MSKMSGAFFLALFLFSAGARAEEKLPDPREVFSWDRQERLLGFKSVEKIAPTRPVAAGGQVRELPPASSPGALKMARELESVADRLLKNGQTVGVLVVHRGEILAERYAHGFTPADRWTSFSVAKSITGTLAGAAVKDGLLRLDEQVVKYVPELSSSAYEGVTVRHLLTMTSGVEWDETYTESGSDTARLARGFGSADPLNDLAGLPREAEPGTHFSYKTGESNLLGLVVSRAAGRPLAQYLSEKIWRPCGMETEAAWAVDAEGREMAGCCLSMSLRDYARFGLFVLEEAARPEGRLLPRGWFQEATRPVLGHNYGYQWHLAGEGIFMASGIFGQMIAIDPATDSVAVLLSAWDSPLSEDGNSRRYAFLMQVRGIVLKNGGGVAGKK